MPRVFELRLHEHVGRFGLLPADARVLADEQAGQALGHAARGLGVVVGESQAERVGLAPAARRPDGRGDLQADGRVHLGHDVVHWLRPTFFGIQIQLDDELFEPGAAHDLLGDGLQPFVDRRRDRGPNIFVRHTLPHDLNQGFRRVTIGQDARDEQGREGTYEGRDDDQPAAAPENRPDVGRRELFARKHDEDLLSGLDGARRPDGTRADILTQKRQQHCDPDTHGVPARLGREPRGQVADVVEVVVEQRGRRGERDHASDGQLCLHAGRGAAVRCRAACGLCRTAPVLACTQQDLEPVADEPTGTEVQRVRNVSRVNSGTTVTARR